MQVELVVKVDGLPATFSQRIDEQPVKQCGLLPYSAQAATKMDEWMRPLLVFGDTSLFGNKEQGYDAQQRGNTRTQKRQDDQDISEEAPLAVPTISPTRPSRNMRLTSLL